MRTRSVAWKGLEQWKKEVQRAHATLENSGLAVQLHAYETTLNAKRF
jgi:uncharacterized protein YqgV (UPF0045/DUF77 family)